MSTALKTEFPALARPEPRPQTARLPALLPTAEGATRLFFNREVSLLEFHRRVLEEAFDDSNPLLERLKFISIFSSNLDEFFMIRVSGLKEELEENVTELSPDGMTPSEQLQEIRRCIEPLLEQQTTCLREELLPQLEAAGIRVVDYASLSPEEQEDLNAYFMEKVFPILTPLAVDQSHPFPYISPLSLNLGLMVEAAPGHSPGDPIYKHEPRFVRIKVPSLVPRFVPVGKLESKFVLLEELIEANRDSLFPGMITGACHRFRVTRDADIDIREDEAQDLLGVLQQELRQRRFGTPVRLEVSADMPEEMITYLRQALGLEVDDVYLINGPLNLQDFMFLYDLKRPDLKDAPFCAAAPEWNRKRSIFDVLKEIG